MAPITTYLLLIIHATHLAFAQTSSDNSELNSGDFAYGSGDGDPYNPSTGSYDLGSGYSSTDQTCYFPSGDIAGGNVPCNPDAEVSTCCGDRSSCLANGLCLVGDTSDGLGATLNTGVEFARGACTDPTWQDPACFQHCLRSRPGSPDSNGAAVFECGTSGFAHAASYCCENGVDAKTACCATSTLLFELGPGTFGSMSSPTTIASAPPSEEPTVTVTTTVISDRTYTVPCTSESGSLVLVTSGLFPTGEVQPTPGITTVSESRSRETETETSVGSETSGRQSAAGGNGTTAGVTATSPLPFTASGAERMRVGVWESVVLALMGLFYL
ncbi:MAG: hypothetical protein M1820_009856 [Bogoriella megaspora]|nr:MAG: hypothetical protein M1820_009856 [Bogoriella megaspora]